VSRSVSILVAVTLAACGSSSPDPRVGLEMEVGLALVIDPEPPAPPGSPVRVLHRLHDDATVRCAGPRSELRFDCIHEGTWTATTCDRESAVPEEGARLAIPLCVVTVAEGRLFDLAAYVDLDGDGRLGGGEPYGIASDHNPFVGSRERHADVEIRVSMPFGARAPEDERRRLREERAAAQEAARLAALAEHDRVRGAIVGLRSFDRATRDEAILELLQHPEHGPEIAGAVLPLLDHPDGSVRGQLLHLLGHVATSQPGVVEALIAHVDDAELSVRLIAIEALGNGHARTPEVVEILVASLEDGLLRDDASSALVELDRQMLLPVTIEALVAHARTGSTPGRIAAIGTLARIGRAATGALPALRELEGDRACDEDGIGGPVCVAEIAHVAVREIETSTR
jgi:hypothetical protein